VLNRWAFAGLLDCEVGHLAAEGGRAFGGWRTPVGIRGIGGATVLRCRGFSLVELLAVIAIIVLLAALLVPAFVRSRARAHEATCQTRLRQLGMACTTYLIDNDEGWPIEDYRREEMTWRNQLLPYVGSAELFRCPAFVPRRDPPDDVLLSQGYGFHALLGPYPGMNPRWYDEAKEWVYPTEADVGPARIIVVADSQELAIGHFPSDLDNLCWANGPDMAGSVAGDGRRPASWLRHPGGTAICFLDGHVKLFLPGQLLAYVPRAWHKQGKSPPPNW